MDRIHDRLSPDRFRAAHGARRGPLALLGSLGLGAVCMAAALAPSDPVPPPGETGGPLPGLSKAETRLWLEGRRLFDRDFTVADGLGLPDYNADSCRACHIDPTIGGAGALELNVSRFGHDGGGAGPFTNLPGGQGLSKLRPPPILTRENYPVGNADPATNADVFEQRQTPAVFGLGLIESIPDEVILANQDPFDLNGDGIYGVARVLTIAGQQEVGRFGWKAQVPLVEDFVRDAMGGELGITTPDDGRGFAFLSDDDDVPDPEITEAQVDKLAFFMAKLAPPKPNDPDNPTALEGKAIFSALRCDRCHIPSLEGANGPVPLYSDLLLHDVMGLNFRGMAEPGADVGMYRTPPLWGVSHTAPYLHDGRAATLEEAILMHRSEAVFSATAFGSLSATERRALTVFLESL